jgi:predicted peroxiredoxin/TusA-related sulfurtransferase
MGKNK